MLTVPLANDPTRVAAWFWRQAGLAEAAPWPRDLEPAVMAHLPLVVCGLPNLTPDRARAWLARWGWRGDLACADERIHGYLHAEGGHGIVFVEAHDPPDERRFTLAHEVAHFLRDYHLPRLRATARLGERAVAAFDGRRAPTIRERLDGWLNGIDLAPPGELVPAAGSPGRAARIWRAEDEADRLGAELLAPAGVVAARLTAVRVPTAAACRTYAEQLLRDEFGLPVSVARGYAATITETIVRPTFAERLGLR